MKGVVQLVTGWIKQFLADKDVHMLHCSNPQSENSILYLLEDMQCRDSRDVLSKKGDSCFTCGKRGHKARDCWKNKAKDDKDEPEAVPKSVHQPKDTTSRHSNCYVCGEAGHFKADCPKKKDKQADKDLRKVRRLSQAEETHQLTCRKGLLMVISVHLY